GPILRRRRSARRRLPRGARSYRTLMPVPIIVASGNGAPGLPVGIRILARGGSALDAVEACAKVIEADPTDTSVGRGGRPNFLALDRKGHLASAVTTSGWAYKYPGRVGDSPIVGAGNYCDTRYGAAACTGYGELAIRNLSAKTAVDRLAAGMRADEVAHSTIADANALEDAAFNVVVLTTKGEHASATNREGRQYAWMTTEMKEAATAPRALVPRG